MPSASSEQEAGTASTHAESFPPISAPDARILILGSMPGQQSLRAQAYYAHPRNAFWPIMATLLGFDPGAAYRLRADALRRHGIALWDVLQSCTRPGSLDADIDSASMVCNDFHTFLDNHRDITRVCCNGATAYQLFTRRVLPGLPSSHQPDVLRLPSTSPAHAGMSRETKLQAWASALQSPVSTTHP